MCDPQTLEKQELVFLLRALITRQNENTSHKQAQLFDLRWEQIEKMNAWAKPQSQTPNFANSTRPMNVRPGRRWVFFFFFFFASSSTADASFSIREPLQLLCGGVSLCCGVFWYNMYCNYRNTNSFSGSSKKITIHSQWNGVVI